MRKKNEAIIDRIIRNIRNPFEYKEDYCKPVRVGNFWCNNYTEYESHGDRKTLSVEEYLNKIRPYLKDILNDLKKIWYIKNPILTINFISYEDNGEDRVMHLKSDKIEIMINDKADEGKEELFQPLLSVI